MCPLPLLSHTAHRIQLCDPLDIAENHQRRKHDLRWEKRGQDTRRLDHALQVFKLATTRVRLAIGVMLIRAGERLQSAQPGAQAVSGSKTP